MIIGIVASQRKAAANATKWTYIGTSGSSDETWVPTVATRSSCISSGEMSGLLQSSRPASNYPVGYIMQVAHSRRCNSAVESCRVDGRGRPLPVSCPAQYYRAD